eukprot:359537-Chlamydomonas_euryale.AAC.4
MAVQFLSLHLRTLRLPGTSKEGRGRRATLGGWRRSRCSITAMHLAARLQVWGAGLQGLWDRRTGRTSRGGAGYVQAVS